MNLLFVDLQRVCGLLVSPENPPERRVHIAQNEAARRQIPRHAKVLFNRCKVVEQMPPVLCRGFKPGKSVGNGSQFHSPDCFVIAYETALFPGGLQRGPGLVRQARVLQKFPGERKSRTRMTDAYKLRY